MFGGTAFERDVDEEEFTNILFVPSNFRAQRSTTHQTPSSPSRTLRGTPGRTTSRTPPPPPLNLINEVPADRIAPGIFKATEEHYTGRPSEWMTLGDLSPFPERRREGQRGDASGRQDVQGNWIKVCGITKDDLADVIRHFRRYGDIQSIRQPEGPTGKNWIFLKFYTEQAVSMALHSNGKMIGNGKCFGVVEPLETERTLLEMPCTVESIPTSSIGSLGESSEPGVTGGGESSSGPVFPVVPALQLPVQEGPLQPTTGNETDSRLKYYLKFLFG